MVSEKLKRILKVTKRLCEEPPMSSTTNPQKHEKLFNLLSRSTDCIWRLPNHAKISADTAKKRRRSDGNKMSFQSDVSYPQKVPDRSATESMMQTSFVIMETSPSDEAKIASVPSSSFRNYPIEQGDPPAVDERITTICYFQPSAQQRLLYSEIYRSERDWLDPIGGDIEVLEQFFPDSNNSANSSGPTGGKKDISKLDPKTISRES